MAKPLFIALAVFCTICAQARDYYVSTTGRDNNSGTLSKPFRTLDRGVKPLLPGDRLYIRGGTYKESLSGEIPGGTSWSTPVTITAYPGENVILRPPAGSLRVFHFGNGTKPGTAQKYIIINELVLDAFSVTYDCVKITDGAHHIRIQNCEIYNAPYQGVLMTDSRSNNNEIINCTIHHNGEDDFSHGLYISTSNNKIDGCEIYSNAGWGVHVYNGAPYNNNNIVSNNRIHDNGVKGRGAGIGLYSGTGHMAVNNVIWNNNGGIYLDYNAQSARVAHNTIHASRDVGIRLGIASQGTQVINNVVSECGNIGIHILPGSTGNVVTRNSLYSNDLLGLNVINYRCDGTASLSLNTGLTGLGLDPLFLNETLHDYHLLTGSSGKGTAAWIDWAPSDISGKARLQPYCNAGAYE